MTDKVKIVLFSGGRGTSKFTRALLHHPQIELTLLVNGYDDGLSTGRIRKYVPGILGPSDFRKNLSYLFDEDQDHQRHLKNLIEYRLPTTESNQTLRQDLVRLVAGQSIQNRDLENLFLGLSVRDARWLSEHLAVFLSYCDRQKEPFDFRDCSIGNILMAAAFLKQGQDFNRSLKALVDYLKPKANVLNVTKGENLILCALKKNGDFLSDEAQIVNPGSAPIEDIFLLERYLNDPEISELNSLRDISAKLSYLKNRSFYPEICQEAREAIHAADIIIYGPGTQHSSLFPSYVTQGCTEAIAENKKAYKVFVGNINADHDIQGETVESIVNKFFFYSNQKGRISADPKSILTHLFIQSNESENEAFTRTLESRGLSVKKLDWEQASGQHSLSLISDELIALAQTKRSEKLMSQHHLISIVVPVLNEERTVSKVLDGLEKLNLFDMNLDKEILVIDGGSTDRSLELIKKHKEVKLFASARKLKRGEAYLEGIQRAKGNVVVFFPSDNEYDVKDIKKVLLPFINEQAKCVLGTRATKSIHMSDTILTIYEGNRFSYFASKYGGILLSILMLAFHNRYITDSLTSVKAFHRRTLLDWNFKSKGVDFDMEVLIKMIEKDEFIYEVPVNFSPRKKSEGKKITMLDGFRSIWTILRSW